MNPPTRRQLLAALGGSVPVASGGSVPMPAPPPPPRRVTLGGPGLGSIAATHNRQYGAAVQNQLLFSDPRLAALAAAECGLLMPDYEAKWGVTQPSEGVFDFGPLDTLLGWAKAHGKPVRGHGLVWYQDNPEWLAPAILQSPRRAVGVLAAHLAAVLAHTAGSIGEWDVVNEAVADPPGSDIPQASGELRDCVWLRALGPGWIATALRLARQNAPRVRLALNEYGTEENAPHHVEKRRRLLALVRSLRQAGVPLDVVGLQGHLQLVQPFSGPPFTRFCRDLRAEGVELVVTEMDVREHWQIPAGIAARDGLVADRVAAFTDAAVEGGVSTFITWGLLDKYSWLASNPFVKRSDGLVHRSLPFDDAYARKPYWQAMADALRR